MIVVDSSVWINLLRGKETSSEGKLREAVDKREVILLDLILMELLQGCRNEPDASRLQSYLGRFPLSNALNEQLAIRSAKNFRLLKSKGVTTRKTTDIIIATFCMENGHRLLHEDRDFTMMVDHLGLMIA